MADQTPDVLSGGTLLGHLQEFRDHPIELLRRLNREQGELGRLRIASVSLFIVNSPALIHELLVEKAGHFQKSRVLRAGLNPLAGQGLFSSEGELWRRQRKLMAPIFQTKRIAAFDECMADCAAQVIDTWADGATLDVLHETTAIAMNVAGRSLFGIDTSGEGDELGRALTVALEWVAAEVMSMPFAVQIGLAEGIHKVGTRLPDKLAASAERIVQRLEHPIMWPTARNREMQAALETLETRVAKLIAERRADPLSGGLARSTSSSPRGLASLATDANPQPPRNDLLSLLLHAHEGTGDAAMSDRQLRDEILTLFVAGHETTANALAWSLYLLARHPEVREALEREAVEVLGERRPTAADLPRLALATRVFKEALRMYPPVVVYERQATGPVQIGSVALDDGGYVAVFPWALHHREELWPDPDRFDPDRFLPEAEAARHRYAWIPFGAGPRVCIGSHFAMQEGPLVLAMIVRKARFELLEDREIEPDPHAATLRPLGGIPARVKFHGHGSST